MNRDKSTAIAAALAISYTGSEAVRNMYRLFKEEDGKFSLAYFCRKANISSTGYLSDVMTGKRKLSAKYWSSCAKAFGLSGHMKEYFINLQKLDDSNDEETQTWIENQRKFLQLSWGDMPEAEGLFRATDVFCAFGMFDGTPTKKDLLGYFGEEKEAYVDSSLQFLIKAGIISSTETGYEQKEASLVFDAISGNKEHETYSRLTLERELDELSKWIHSELAHYFALTVSVKKSDYPELLKKCGEKIYEAMFELDESEDADHLVRFNVQIHPTHPMDSRN